MTNDVEKAVERQKWFRALPKETSMHRRRYTQENSVRDKAKPEKGGRLRQTSTEKDGPINFGELPKMSKEVSKIERY